jgi:tetratricopeptide (TPR) repeat protein
MISASKSTVSSQKNPFIIVLAIVLLVCAAYGLSLNNGFVWDDETFIVNNAHVHDISQWPQYFTLAGTVSSDPVLSRVYRPLQTFSFALDAALWGTRAGGFHLTSMLLHLATCFAIFFAFAPLVGRRSVVIAAALFSVHPTLSESVLSLASRGNQLYTLFALFSLGFFVRMVRPWDKYHLSSITLALMALFSKEPAIAYLALLPLVQMVFGLPWSLRDRRSVLLYAPFIMIAGFFLWARAAVVASAQVIPYWGGSLGATMLLQAKVFILYFRLLFWPFYLQGRYTIAGPDALAAAALIANVVLVIAAVLAWRRSRNGKLLALAIAWFYLSLAPVSNLIPLPGAMMGERFLYFTFAGMFPLLLGTIEEQAWDRYSRFVLPAALILLAAFFFMDVTRTMVWKDNAHYFKLLSVQEPNNPVVQLRMAMTELEAGDIAQALPRLERLVKTGFSTPFSADRAAVSYWYGKALLLSDRPTEAYVQFSQAAALATSRSRDLVLLLAEAAARSNDLKTARSLLEQEVKSSPGDDMFWNSLGNVLSMAGDSRAAVRAYSKAVEINPSNREAAVNLQNVQRSSTGREQK